LRWIKELMQNPDAEPRYVISRLRSGTRVFSLDGKPLCLSGVLPREVGEARELEVLVGKQARIPMRLILVRVPKNVGDERREDLKTIAKENYRQIREETLFLADWTILVTNVPSSMLTLEEVLICYRLRWQIELLFKLWKQDTLVDSWRTSKKKPYRILTEVYAKLCAMVIQQWFLQIGCWQDPHRSFFQAAALLRREANRVMMALRQGSLEPLVASLTDQLERAGGRLFQRQKHPGSDQLILSKRIN
jgi:hypothetical protein